MQGHGHCVQNICDEDLEGVPAKKNLMSMNIDRRKDSNELKDFLLRDHGLDVRSVPMGMIYHPRERGIIAKVRLSMNRRHLIVVKQNIVIFARRRR